MRPYRLSHQARADLDEIWAYSVGKWGRRKAADYLRHIRLAVELVAERPELGGQHEGIGSEYRKRPVGSHVIFYRAGEAVEIVRVLHQNMDIRLHLA
ncbi:MAG: type II toxin-antitoxin system RelE/ParE family toxin [Phenylobacterium sp.]|nr:type II toxin-antitoxin system RelE/ParE family toxin [Phenylobacterium sp.]